MPEYKVSIVVVGEDRASAPLGKVGGALSGIGTIAGGILAADVFKKIAGGIMDMAKNAVSATANLQAMQIGLESLVARELTNQEGGKYFGDMKAALQGAKQPAAALMDELANIAMISPYQLETVNNTFRMQMAFGATTEQATKLTKGMLDMAAGIGAGGEQLDRMAYNFAQIRMQGKVTAMDIRQLAMAGFDLTSVLKYTGKQMGVNIQSHEDFNAAIASGKITWKDFTESFAKYSEENFGGAAQRMALTLNGLASTFKDVFALTMPKVLGPAAEHVTKFLSGVLEDFLKVRESGVLDDLGTRLGDSIGRGIGHLQSFLTKAGQFKDIVIGYFDQVGMKFGSMEKMALARIFPGAGVALTLIDLLTNIKGVRDGFEELKTKAQTAWGFLQEGGAGGMLNALTQFVDSKTASQVVGTIFGIGKAFDELRDKAGAIFGAVKSGNLQGLLHLLLPSDIAKSVGNRMATIGAYIRTGLGGFQKFWKEHGANIVAVVKKNFGALGQYFSKIGTALSTGLGNVAKDLLPWLAEKFAQLGMWFQNNGPAISAAITNMGNIFRPVLAALGQTIAKILSVVFTAWPVLKAILDGIIRLVLDIASVVVNVLAGNWAGAWESIKAAVGNVVIGIENILLNLVAWLLTTFLGGDFQTWLTTVKTKWGEFKTAAAEKFEEVKTAITTKFAEIKTAAATKFEEIKTTITGIVDGIRSAMEDKFLAAKATIDTVTSAVGGVIAKLGELWDWVQANVISIKIHFPSPPGWVSDLLDDGQINNSAGGSTEDEGDGKAYGGSIRAGRLYRINEGGNQEAFLPNVSGQMLAAHRLERILAGAGGGGGGRTENKYYGPVTQVIDSASLSLEDRWRSLGFEGV